jgi:hypothetical protein
MRSVEEAEPPLVMRVGQEDGCSREVTFTVPVRDAVWKGWGVR